MSDYRHFRISGRASLDGAGYTVTVFNAINMREKLPELHENGRPKVFKEFGVAMDTARRAIDRLLSEPVKTADDSELEALRLELAAARERIAKLEATIARAKGLTDYAITATVIPSLNSANAITYKGMHDVLCIISKNLEAEVK